MKKVYIACPYTNGDVAVNVKNAMECFNELIKNGFAPFNPILSHFQHMAHPLPYDKWLELDFEWLKVCDCILRLGGESKGADMEVAFAVKNKIPVFFSIESVIYHFNNVTFPLREVK